MTVYRTLDEVLTLRQHQVRVEPGSAYPSAGILNRGRGLFAKPALSGSQTSYSHLFRLAEGQLVYSKLFAWEGAVAVVAEPFVGSFVSSEFPTFDVDLSAVDLSYLRHFTASEAFGATMAGLTTGLGQRRQRVNVADFLTAQIPLPPVREQRRLAAYLDEVQAKTQAAGETGGVRIAVQRTIAQWLDDMPARIRIDGMADVNPLPAFVGPGETVGFVPMAAVSDRSGEVVEVRSVVRGSLTSGYKQFLDGDLIFARITPCMQNGKCAVYGSELLPVAYGSTEFHVIRANPTIIRWLHAVLRTDWFIEAAQGSFTGTAGQQRVPASYLRGFQVPLPADIDAATRHLAGLVSRQHDVEALGMSAQTLRRALLPAARNEIFSAMR